MDKKESINFTEDILNDDNNINQAVENSYSELLFLYSSMLTTLSSLIYSKNISDDYKSDFILMCEKVTLDNKKHQEKLNLLRFIVSEVLDLDIDFSFLMVKESNNVAEYYNDIDSTHVRI